MNHLILKIISKNYKGKFVNILLFSLVSLLSSSSFAEQKELPYNGFEFANNQGSIGEISALFLKPSSLSLHPMTNDFMGNTDKLMTGSSNLGLHLFWEDGKGSLHSVASNFYWRAITPSFRPKAGEPPFETPVGFYADWLDLQTAFASTTKTWIGGFKYQIGVNYGNISDRGIKFAHRWIHARIGEPYSDLNYENQPIGVTKGGDFMIAYITPPIAFWSIRINWQGAVGVDYSKVMYEHYLMGNMILTISKKLKLGFERKISTQISSEFYENIEPRRYESSFSIMFFNYFQPSMKYVSPYLKDDPQGQLYVDLVNFTAPF